MPTRLGFKRYHGRGFTGSESKLPFHLGSFPHTGSLSSLPCFLAGTANAPGTIPSFPSGTTLEGTQSQRASGRSTVRQKKKKIFSPRASIILQNAVLDLWPWARPRSSLCVTADGAARKASSPSPSGKEPRLHSLSEQRAEMQSRHATPQG